MGISGRFQFQWEADAGSIEGSPARPSQQSFPLEILGGVVEYHEKLKDPRWQKRRLEVFERDHWTCKSCGEKEKTLCVHHIFYLPKYEPWDIPIGLLITFCEDCHSAEMKCNGVFCINCPDYLVEDGCSGALNTPKYLIECISSLLNEIWKWDKEGDFCASLGVIASGVRQCRE